MNWVVTRNKNKKRISSVLQKRTIIHEGNEIACVLRKGCVRVRNCYKDSQSTNLALSKVHHSDSVVPTLKLTSRNERVCSSFPEVSFKVGTTKSEWGTLCKTAWATSR